MDDSWSEEGPQLLPASSPLSGRNLSLDSLSDSRLNLVNSRKGLFSPLSPSASYANQLEARGSAVGPLEVRIFVIPPLCPGIVPINGHGLILALLSCKSIF